MFHFAVVFIIPVCVPAYRALQANTVVVGFERNTQPHMRFLYETRWRFNICVIDENVHAWFVSERALGCQSCSCDSNNSNCPESSGYVYCSDDTPQSPSMPNCIVHLQICSLAMLLWLNTLNDFAQERDELAPNTDRGLSAGVHESASSPRTQTNTR